MAVSSRAQIYARLAAERNRKITIAHLRDLAAAHAAAGSRSAEGVMLALSDLYETSDHPYQQANRADFDRWRQLNGSDAFATARAGD